MSLKDHTKSITHNTIGNIISAFLLYGGAIVLSALTGYSAFIKGLPLYQVIPLGVAVLLGVALASNLIDLIFIRHRRYGREPPAEAAPAKRGAEASAVERTLEEPLALGGQPPPIISEASYTGREKWLQDVAERDRQQIEWAVQITDCSLDGGYTSPTPHVIFRFQIFNGSVFPVSIDRKIDGHISYGSRRLKGELTLGGKWTTGNLKPRYSTTVEIFQWLEPDDAAMLEAERNKLQTSHETYFKFEYLIVTIKGGDGFEKVIPKPLWFINQLRGITIDGKLR